MKIRVLHFAGPSMKRGAEMFAKRLSNRLKDEGIESTVFFYPEGKGELRVHFQILSLIRRIRPNIVHLHWSRYLRPLYLMKNLGMLRDTRIVMGQIGFSSFFIKSGVKARIVGHLIDRLCDRVVAVCSAVGEDFQQIFPWISANKLALINNGVDIKGFLSSAGNREAFRISIGVNHNETLMISVGAFSPEKNHAFLLRCLSKLDPYGWKMIFVGDGPTRPDCERLARDLMLDKCILFAGEKDNVAEFLNASDIFLLPSLTEGLSLALIEAGLLGLPALASDKGGNSEIVQDGLTGFILSLDEKAWVEKLTELIRNPELRRRMGKEATLLCQRKFNLDDIAIQYVNLYREVLCEK